MLLSTSGVNLQAWPEDFEKTMVIGRKKMEEKGDLSRLVLCGYYDSAL